jgi:very-short-patch-repair endonuclease
MTDSEIALWRHLRAHRLNGEKFRRQQPIGRYVVDFVHFGARLIVEADGGQHNRSAADERRDTWLRAQGFTVMRFWNNEIMQNLAGVLETITAAVSELSTQAVAPARAPAPALAPSPPPLSREGRGEQSNHMSSTPNAEEEFASHISPSPLAGEGLGRGGQSHQNSPSPLAGEGLGRGEGVVAATKAQLTAKDSS